MPRITQAKYNERHDILRDILLEESHYFSVLEPTEQWAVHEYYATSFDLTNRQLGTYRREVTKRSPSLPHRAGRAVQKFKREILALEARTKQVVAEQSPVGKRRYRRKSDTFIQIGAEVHPTPDMRKLAEALIEVARERVGAVRRQEASKE